MHRPHRLLPILVAFVAANLPPTPLTAQVPPSPAMPWSVLLGGSGFEECEQWNQVCVAANGDVLLCGRTTSANFGPTSGPGLQGPEDAFVARIRGGAVVWKILLGGSGRDAARAIVEANGDVYVGGRTSSANFPVTPGAVQSSYGGGTADLGDGFVVRLSNALSSAPTVTWATYLGGSGNDSVLTMTWSPASDRLAVGGWTASTNLPMGWASYQPTNANVVPPPAGQLGADGFLALLDTGVAPTTLLATTYLGGMHDDLVIDVTEARFCPGSGTGCGGGAGTLTSTWVVAGRTMSANFPTTANGVDVTLGGVQDAFVAVLDGTLQSLWYGTYLGGNGDDVPWGMTIGPASPWDVFLAGQTTSPDFPTTPGALQTTHAGGGYYGVDAFVTRIDLGLTTASNLTWSTYLGGPGDDSIMDLEVEACGMVTAVGLAASPPFPHTTAGALQPVFQAGGGPPVGPTDGFVVRLDPSRVGSAQRVYGTFLGGSQNQENVTDVALRGDGSAVVVGWTLSGNFPRTGAAPYQGNSDVFVSELSLLPSPVQRYGAPSPAGTLLHLAVNSQPSPGNSQFEVHVHDAPPQMPGVLFFGTPAAAAIPVPGLGIDALLLTIPVGVPAIADQHGFARLPVPIPAGYAWGGLGLQAVWLDLSSSQPFRASDALR